MLPLLAEITADPATMMLLADSDSGAAGIAFPFLAGPAVFAAVYGGIYRYYRNTDKRHHFEKETEVAVGNLQQDERKVRSKTRLKNRHMSDSNVTDHLKRVRRIQVQ